MEKKEAAYMDTVAKLRADDMEVAKAMKKYVDGEAKRFKNDPDSAKRDALEALQRTGVATKQGNLKKKIVSWE